MTPHAPVDELRQWIQDHLDPLDDDAPSLIGPTPSDYDFNAEFFVDPDRPVRAAAVLVGLVERPTGVSVILTRRADTLRSHTGQVALPGGRRDPGETSWQTALREAQEEIGLDPAFVQVAGLSTPYRTGSDYLITPVVAFISPGFALTPNPDEVAEIFETPFGFLMDPGSYEERERLMPSGPSRRFYAMTHESRLIWGATAGILRALYNRLYGAAVA